MKKITGILILTVVILIAACRSKAAKDEAAKESYEQTKETLEDKERNNPLLFLTVSSHDKHNLFGQTVIKANITNTAKVCTYKEVQLELAFYSNSGTLLEKDNETVYDAITPGNSVDHKTKYYAPKGTDSIAIKIISAKSN